MYRVLYEYTNDAGQPLVSTTEYDAEKPALAAARKLRRQGGPAGIAITRTVTSVTDEYGYERVYAVDYDVHRALEAPLKPTKAQQRSMARQGNPLGL